MDTNSQKAKMAKCVNAVLEYFDLSKNQLFAHRRYRNIVYARHILMCFLYDVGITKVEIGRICGGLDHATVCKGMERIKGLCDVYPEVKNDMEVIRKLIDER